MNKRQLVSILTASVAIILGASGCYTKFATPRREYQPSKELMVVDSTGDTVRVITKTDTVRTSEQEICIWERDIAGFPRLRCFQSRHSHGYYLYSNVPWWYRAHPHVYDYGYCPPNYYYDFHRGTCRYIWSSSPPGGGRQPSQPRVSDPPARRPRVQGLEDAEPTPSGSSNQTGASAPSPAPLAPSQSKSSSPSVVGDSRGTASESKDSSDSADSQKSEESKPEMRRNPRRF